MAVRDTLAKMAMPNSRNKPQPSNFSLCLRPWSWKKNKMDGCKADCSGGKVVRIKEQAFERAFVDSQLIAGTHKLNPGSQLYKRRYGDKQRKYNEELLNCPQRVVGALQYLVKQVEESRNRHKKQNIHVLRRRQRRNAHVDGRPDAHGGQGAEHGKNLARNMLAF